MPVLTGDEKVLTISLPPDLLAKAEALARQEELSLSELFEKAFRAYLSEYVGRVLEESRRYAATRNPHGYTEEDIPRLVSEVRAEIALEALSRKAS